MTEDWDEFEEFDEDEGFDEEDFEEPTPEDIAEIKRGIQDIRMGYGYEMLKTDGRYYFKCLKCGRTADMDLRRNETFPHKFDCPMRDRIKD